MGGFRLDNIASPNGTLITTFSQYSKSNIHDISGLMQELFSFPRFDYRRPSVVLTLDFSHIKGFLTGSKKMSGSARWTSKSELSLPAILTQPTTDQGLFLPFLVKEGFQSFSVSLRGRQVRPGQMSVPDVTLLSHVETDACYYQVECRKIPLHASCTAILYQDFW